MKGTTQTKTQEAPRMPRQHLRSCVACRVTDDKQALVRFVRTPKGEVVCDPTGRQAGRGAYLCLKETCFNRARKGHLLDRALKVGLSDVDYQRLEEEYSSQRNKIDRV